MSATFCLLRAGRIPYVGGVLELGGHQRGRGAEGVGAPLRRVPSILRWRVGVWDIWGILITEREWGMDNAITYVYKILNPMKSWGLFH